MCKHAIIYFWVFSYQNIQYSHFTFIYVFCLYNESTSKEYRHRNTKFNWTTQILSELQISFRVWASNDPLTESMLHFSMQQLHVMQLTVQIISDVAVERATDTAHNTVRQTAEGPGPNFSPAVSVSIWLGETIMHCHQYISYESFFLSSFLLFPTCFVTAWGQ